MKVLIISHNPITTYNNMGKTFLGLFSAFKQEELCQLYVYPTIPDVRKCCSYFRITDKDVLRSYYKFKVKGREIQDVEIDENKHDLFENKEDIEIYRNKKNKKPFRMFLRDLMWKCSHWSTKELNSWLKKENPSCVFVAPGTAKFLYDIAFKIAKKFNLPIVTYICDDYYFVKDKRCWIEKIQQRKLKKKIEKLMKRTSHIITICDELKDIYGEKFQIPATTIMTASNYKIAEAPIIKESIQSITYMGNIRCNRYVPLTQIGRAIDEINRECKTNFSLNIYTAETDETILKHLEDVQSIKLCGFVTGSEFDRIFHQADILLHTEAFDKESIDLVKHSISTKIADGLGSGICLFAYGPEQVASMKYLINNKAAVIVIKYEELKKILLQLFFNSEDRVKIISNALRVAKQNHEDKIVGDKCFQLLKTINR